MNNYDFGYDFKFSSDDEQNVDFVDENDEDLKKAIEESLKDDIDDVIELSKKTNLQLFTEELQLEAAVKLSLSTKQPVYKAPLGKIYMIDDIFKDTLFNLLIERGCLKDLYAFCITRWHYYDIIRRERYKIDDKLLSLKQIHPSSIKFKIFNFEKTRCFEFNNNGYKVYTKQYYVAANCDKCGCVTKNTILYIKIPAAYEEINIGNKKESRRVIPITFRLNNDTFFYEHDKKLKRGINSDDNIKLLLDRCLYDKQCDELLKFGY
jgi:hypothetical protein